MQFEDAGAFNPTRLNALLEKDEELKYSLLQKYSDDKFALVKRYPSLIPFFVEQKKFSGGQLLDLSLTYPLFADFVFPDTLLIYTYEYFI